MMIYSNCKGGIKLLFRQILLPFRFMYNFYKDLTLKKIPSFLWI